MADFKKLKTTPAPFMARDMEGVTWIEPKLVCEVIYQVVTKNWKLRMPRFHTLRTDKDASECTLDQIEGRENVLLKTNQSYN